MTGLMNLRILTAGVVAAGALVGSHGIGNAQEALGADDYRLLPLRVHLLRSKTVPELNCRLQETDIQRILGKINGIWKQAAVQFYAESILEEEPGGQELYQGLGANRNEGHLRLIRPRASLSDTTFHLYYLSQMRPNGICLNRSYQMLFVKDTAALNKVEGGIDEPLPRVSAHEIGHALDLEHRQDTFNLMASGTTGTGLNEAEIATSRAAAQKLAWCLKPADALAMAEKLAPEKAVPAKALYTALAALPAGEVSRTARERLTKGD